MKPSKELTPFQRALVDSVLENYKNLPEDDEDFDAAGLLNKIKSRAKQLPEKQRAWFDGIDDISQ